MDQCASTTEDPPVESLSRLARPGRKTIGTAGAGLLLGIAGLWWGGIPYLAGGSPATSIEISAEATPVAAANDTPDPAKLIVGRWEQFNRGRRVLVVREDGTATMDVNLEGAWAYVVGEKLEFQIEWTLDKSRLLLKMIGGKPDGALKFVASVYGNERNHQVETLTSDQMILVDEKDKSRDIWKRIEPASP